MGWTSGGKGQEFQRKVVVAEINLKSSGYKVMAGVTSTGKKIRGGGDKNTRARNVTCRRQEVK